MKTLSSGVADLVSDPGVLVGEYVVWATDDDVFNSVAAPLLAGGGDGEPAVFVTMTHEPGQAARRLPQRVEVVDARLVRAMTRVAAADHLAFGEPPAFSQLSQL